MHTIFTSLWTTRRLSRLTFVFLGLGICVFAWGLQYKLSLYYPPHSSFHEVPEAKLLSRNEQPRIAVHPLVEGQKDALTNLQRNPASLILAGLINLALGIVLLPERGFLPLGTKPWLLATQASLDPFFFRPPPISA
jgi:hypothetical protein